MRQMQVAQDAILLVKVFAMRAVIVDAKDVQDVRGTVVPLARVDVKEALVVLTKHKVQLLLHILKAIRQERIQALVLLDV